MPSGGARPGAGRKKGFSPPPKENKKIQKAFRIDPIIWKEFEKIFPEKKLIEKLEEAMKNYIQENKEKTEN